MESSGSSEPVEVNEIVAGVSPKVADEFATATGAWFGLDTTLTVVDPVRPSSSVTVRVAV